MTDTKVKLKKTEKEYMDEFIHTIQVVSAEEARQERLHNLQQLIKTKAEVISKMISEHAKESYTELPVALASLPSGGAEWLAKLMKLNGYNVYYEDANGSELDNTESAQIMVISWETIVQP